MFAISLEAGSFARAAGLLEGEVGRIERELRTLTQRRARLAKEALARATPIGQRQPGSADEGRAHMRELWHQETTGPSESLVFNEAPYSLFQFTGTRPHTIRAGEAQTLHFFAGGSEVFTGEVQHPGQAPNPNLLRALDDQLSKGQGDLFDWGLLEMGRLAREIG